MAPFPRGYTIDISGQKFGRLLVIGYHGTTGYPNHFALWDCVCDCGRNCIAMGATLKAGRKRSCGCLLRESRVANGTKLGKTHPRKTGPANPRWNPNRDFARRERSRNAVEVRKFRSAVFDRDGKFCMCCGSQERVVVHHLLSYKKFPELRFDPNNGIPVCHKHHKDFHRLYGIRNFSKEDFLDFLLDFPQSRWKDPKPCL